MSNLIPLRDVCVALDATQSRLQQIFQFGREVAAGRVPATAEDRARLAAEARKAREFVACAASFLCRAPAANDADAVGVR